MKTLILLFPLLVLLSDTLFSKSRNHNQYYGFYVTKAHLHYVFQKIKRTSTINPKALSDAFSYYEDNRYGKHLASDFLAIIDYTKRATQKRLYIINLHSGKVLRYLVAHGKNSGAKGGRVWRASNAIGSNMTPYGFFKLGHKEGTTYKKRYKYLSVKGLEWKNRNAQKRDILLHTASYVAWSGRSNGCFSILPKDKREIFSRLKSALLYSYTGL